MHPRRHWHRALLSILFALGTALAVTTLPDRSLADSSDSEAEQTAETSESDAETTEEDEDDADEKSSASGAAASHGTLTSLLPGDSQLALFFDVESLRTSKYYDPLAEWLRSRSEKTEPLSMLKNEAGIDLAEDVSAVAIGFPVATPKALRSSKRATVSLKGDFDPEKLTALLKETFDDIESREVSDDLTVHTIKTSELAVMGDRVVITSGDEEYRTSAWEAVTDESTSLKRALDEETLLDRLEGQQSFWMLNRGVGETSNPQLSDLDAAVIGVHLTGGLNLQLVARAADKKAASKMKTQIEQLKKQSKNNPMLATIGVNPLVDNLALEIDDETMSASTSMTSSELDTLVSSLEQFMRSRMKQRMQGGARKGGSSSALPIPKKGNDTSTSTASDDESSDGDGDEEGDEGGVEADFN